MTLDLTNQETYLNSALALARKRLRGFRSMAEVAAYEADLNIYPGLSGLAEPAGLMVMEDQALNRAKALKAVLDGEIFWEHAAAGEATRLKLGSKYHIRPNRHLDEKRLGRLICEEEGRPLSPRELAGYFCPHPRELAPWSLGVRHLAQLIYELTGLAREAGRDPEEVRQNQRMLLILSEGAADEAVAGLVRAGFWGLKPENFLFMIQRAFAGLGWREGRLEYEPTSPARLHNHGQMVMQTTFDRAVFHLDAGGRARYLDSREMESLLERCRDKISFNIEDLSYLTGAIDLDAIALALELGERGYGMTMEIVANNPERPIKGGMCAYDPGLARDVVVESFQLKGWAPEDIKFLNKNCNHYPNPARIWRQVKEKGLPLPLLVKDGYLYFQPVQGDQNFLTKTAYIRRRHLRPIQSWKSPKDTKTALQAMKRQDDQPGFKDFMNRFQAG